MPSTLVPLLKRNYNGMRATYRRGGRQMQNSHAVNLAHQNSSLYDPITIYEKEKEDGLKPGLSILLDALKACSNLKALHTGMRIHAAVIVGGDYANILVGNTLINMYAKCGKRFDASSVFDRMPDHNVVSWNAIIFGYVEIGDSKMALQCFQSMQDEGFIPNARTYVAALKACSKSAAKEEGEQVNCKFQRIQCLENGLAIHSQLEKGGHELDNFVGSILVDMYAKCGSMAHAHWVFDRLGHQNLVSWNSMIFGYIEIGECGFALHLFALMQNEGVTPNNRTFVAALKACAACAVKEEGKQIEGKLVKVGCLEKGMAIHAHLMKTSNELDIFVASTLVDMYAKCGSMMHACHVFDRMSYHDVVTWTAVVFGYAEAGECDLALQSCKRMQDEDFTPNSVTYVAILKACGICASKGNDEEAKGKLVKIDCLEKGIAIHSQLGKQVLVLDTIVANTLIDMYAKCGSMVHAYRVFETMPYHDVVSWSAMIFGYTENEDNDLAIRSFMQMQDEGFAPNALTYVAVLKACGNVAALECGHKIYVQICNAGLQNDALVATSLVDFYGKCGNMADAERVFNSMSTKDLVAYSALLAGYAHQGDTKRAFDLFERIEQEHVKVDGVTFLSLLTVCSHSGLVDKGREYFRDMCSRYMVIPGIEHYACMVDLLSRANRLNDAVLMLKNMPFKPNQTIWRIVLGACRKWKDVAVGRLAFDSILQFDDKDTSAYVLMANIYAICGMQEESAKIEALGNNVGGGKPEQSVWTDEFGTIHSFMAGDISHPQNEDIQAKLQHILHEFEGRHVPCLGDVIMDVSDEGRHELCGHTERLAIGCALINTAPHTTIRIVKNDEVCDDCHKAIAIIAKLEQRFVICKDAIQFHEFKDGRCSCGG